MNDYIIAVDRDGKPYIAHHGILGQKWGIRRFQNKDGSRTAEGKKRYSEEQIAQMASNKAMKDSFNKMRNNCETDEEKDRKVSRWERARDYDKWDIDFMESIQNSKILYDEDVPALLTEYAKFLDHPDSYMAEEGHKLRSA